MPIVFNPLKFRIILDQKFSLPWLQKPLIFSIQDILGLHLDMNTSYHSWGTSCLSQYLQDNFGIVQIGHNHFLERFLFIIH